MNIVLSAHIINMSPINTPDFQGHFAPDDSIPEINIQVFKFKIFEKEVFAILEKETQLEPFSKFMKRLNDLENFDICKQDLFEELIKSRWPSSNGGNVPKGILQDKQMMRNYIGSNFFDMFDKIEEEYRVVLREHKINQINND